MSPIVLYYLIQSHMAYYGLVWSLIVLYDHIQSYIIYCVLVWSCIVFYSLVWSYIVSYIMYGPLWFCMFLYGLVWSCLVLYGLGSGPLNFKRAYNWGSLENQKLSGRVSYIIFYVHVLLWFCLLLKVSIIFYVFSCVSSSSN